MADYKLFCFCDSPTVQTGFARVAQNLLKRWRPHFKEIDVWGINYFGWPHKLDYVNRIFPPSHNHSWVSPESFQDFLNQLIRGEYTHLWMLQDTFNLSMFKFPEAIRQACWSKKIKSLLYFPVDAPLEKDWTDIIHAVDVPVAYTEYGKAEALRAGPSGPIDIRVIPHGVDTDIYRPLVDRTKVREKSFSKDFCGPDDLVLLNANSNQRRKNPTRSLEILHCLNERGVPAKLVMHMPRTGDGVDLEVVADQLGLKKDKDWTHTGHTFKLNHRTIPESGLNNLYNAADVYLTTTLGEGWGLPITEALAAGCSVVIPANTACLEIAQRLRTTEMGMANRIALMKLEDDATVHGSDNSRLRYPVIADAAASLIKSIWLSGQYAPAMRRSLSDAAREWLSWDRIAGEWLKLFFEQ